ncbi:unnamed protein product [Adineta steineri]|uniref:EF-hand domain-containing protein n=1 Tax=Adineta steineri TaxID=433720 RepID=A0A814PTY8_9BILA|nr:unnamed protein product [Adineta steineri]CAF1110568.1 unnamed protein product [Adineta steineri]
MGSKLSRHNADGNGEHLSKETIEELCQDTGFSEEELLTWHTNFYTDCPDGKLTLKQFEHEYSKIMGKPTQKTSEYVKHMFNVYDEDKNQFIDFKEFVMALSAASVVNRLRLVETLFCIFDLDNDGRITKDEMAKMLHTLVDVTNSSRKHHQHQHPHHHSSNNNNYHANEDDSTKQVDLQKRIDDAFEEFNTNDDNHITKDEFIEWYMKTGLLSDVKSNEINVHHTSRLQQLDKKSRKIKQQKLSVHDNKDGGHRRRSSLVRYMSHMMEHKPVSNLDDDDDDNSNVEVNQNNENNNNGDDSRIRARIDSDDNDSHYSKENERWQHLFNSVLGQIRAQRTSDGNQLEQNNLDNSNRISHFNSWKKHGEEKLKTEYFKQKSNDSSLTPDVVSIRF